MSHRELEIAWAGGLFEGEGCFTLSSSGARTARVYKTAIACISMCDLEPLERFSAALGVGQVEGPYAKKKENHRPAWRWMARGKDRVIDVLALLEPYLTDRRVERAIEVILLDTGGRPHLPMWRTIPGRELLHELPDACPHGHAFDEANTYITPAGRYQCRTCKRLRERERAQRLREPMLRV